jgi:hypothetical protein
MSVYEKAVSLDVVPVPNAVTRIFMLFKGVPDDEILDWHIAQETHWLV